MERADATPLSFGPPAEGYRPGTITVTRAAERERSDAIARALFVAEPDNG